MGTVTTATVSVCVPALNAEPFLAETIESVVAQTFESWELVIVDNASTDRTDAIARSFDDPRIRVLNNRTTVPMVDNWNLAVRATTAPWVKLLCADDLIAPDCLALQVGAAEETPTSAMVAGRRDVIDEDGKVVLHDRGLWGITGVQPGTDVLRRVVASGTNTIGWPGACLFRRDLFDAVGGFEPDWSLLMDLRLWTRLLTKGDFVGLEPSVASFRVWNRAATAGADALGSRHLALLRLVAADPNSGVGSFALSQGLARVRLETLKRRLLYATVGSRSTILRRIPGLLLQPRRAAGSLARPTNG